MTKRMREVVSELNLQCIHTGSLSNVPGNHYVRATMISSDDVGLENEKVFFLQFNRFENDLGCWTVWRTPMMLKEDALAAREKHYPMRGRRLWDSVQLYAVPAGNIYLIL